MVSSLLSTSAGLLAAWLAPFACLFTRPTWERVPVLVEGALLALHRRTVGAALRAAGRDGRPDFARYHRVLNQARWSARAAACVLPGLLVAALASSGPVVIGVDDTLERRWGKRIAARGIYRDAVRSSHGHFTQGQRPALGVALPPRAGPLGGSRLGAAIPDRARSLGATCSGTRQGTQEADGLGQAGLAPDPRWLPRDRQVVAVTDGGYAALNLLAAVRHRVCVVARLRTDARLFDPASLRVHKDVALLAPDLLARVVAGRVNAGPPVSAPFTLWLSTMAAVGLASRSTRTAIWGVRKAGGLGRRPELISDCPTDGQGSVRDLGSVDADSEHVPPPRGSLLGRGFEALRSGCQKAAPTGAHP